jgi:hypothetical protein
MRGRLKRVIIREKESWRGWMVYRKKKISQYHYFWVWRREGVLERMNTVLRVRLRGHAGREATLSAGIMGSPSAKTTERGNPWLRWRQAGKGTETPPAGGHPGAIAEGA